MSLFNKIYQNINLFCKFDKYSIPKMRNYLLQFKTAIHSVKLNANINKLQINLSTFGKGVYTYQYVVNNNILFTSKFVIK